MLEVTTNNYDTTTEVKPTAKQSRLPWDTEPKIDAAIARDNAIAAAQHRHVDPKSAPVQNYARSAFDKEIDLVKNAPDKTRNTQLFKSAANLFELVAAGALDETKVHDALMDASAPWNWSQSGTDQCEKTIKSGRRHGLDSPRDLSHVGTHNGFRIDAETPAKIVLADAFDLERGFWTKRESLQHIYLAALSRMCPPWAVLGCCAAIALANVRPHCTLPPIVSTTGTLNWFCAIAAESAGGKSGSLGVAKELLAKYPVRQRNLGSGEGLGDAYIKPANKETGEPRGQYESIMFVADEVGMLRALANRTGSSLMYVLNTAFSGGQLGSSNRQASSEHVEDMSYRMTLCVNVQARNAGVLIDDKDSGILQRFMWFPASDPRITDETPEWPGELEITPLSKWQYPIHHLTVPYEAWELIRDVRARQMRGEIDALAGHALYIREKFAYALAILDGRDEMNYDDWYLAGIASRISDFTRSWVESEMQQAKEREDTERGQRQGVSQLAADETRSTRTAIRTNEAYNKALALIEKAGSDGITNRELRRKVGESLAKYLPGEHGALARLTDEKRVEARDSTNTTGQKSVVWFAAHS